MSLIILPSPSFWEEVRSRGLSSLVALLISSRKLSSLTEIQYPPIYPPLNCASAGTESHQLQYLLGCVLINPLSQSTRVLQYPATHLPELFEPLSANLIWNAATSGLDPSSPTARSIAALPYECQSTPGLEQQFLLLNLLFSENHCAKAAPWDPALVLVIIFHVLAPISIQRLTCIVQLSSHLLYQLFKANLRDPHCTPNLFY